MKWIEASSAVVVLCRFVPVAALTLGCLAVGLESKPVIGAQGSPAPGLSALIDGIGFARIPAGEFQMGTNAGVAAEAPVHRVRISHDFEIGKLEVTQAQWVAVMGTAHPSVEPRKGAPPEAPTESNPSHFRGLELPVEKVSWNDVQQFLTRMNARDPRYVYRLPTEAEWEYASRARSTQEVPALLNAIAWFAGNSAGRTWPVGQKQPNDWGLSDMHGNVAEWVQDWYGVDYYGVSPAIDPAGPESGSYRVYRGCSWLSPVQDCRPSLRTFNFPIDGYYNVGFRLVRTAK